MKRLIISSTMYNFFVYILLDKEWENKYYIIYDKNFLNSFYLNLINKGIKVSKLRSLRYQKFHFFTNLLNYIGYIFNIFCIIVFIYKKKIEFIYGADHICPLIFRLKPSLVIEDGLLNYKKPKNRKNIKKILIDIFLFRPVVYRACGYEKNIKKIYLTGLAPIPEEIKYKVEIINLKELWNKKNKKEKEEILEIFGFSSGILKKIKNKKNILFTQSLSEDGFITEKEKINLYKKIIENYKQEDLIIKTHPREKTDYKKYFPKVEVLNQSFPAELFDLLDIKFKKVITIYSTAVLNFSDNAEIDFYGTEINRNLLKKLGSYDYIIKRNRFLV